MTQQQIQPPNRPGQMTAVNTPDAHSPYSGAARLAVIGVLCDELLHLGWITG